MDLLTTVFEGRPKYQAKFVDIGGIGNLADILKANNDIEVWFLFINYTAT